MKKAFLLFLNYFLIACSPTIEKPSDFMNKPFPQVRGQSLSKKDVVIPDDFKGKATALLVGYQQKAQFDIDRWILGILQADIPVQIVEVPTIAGMMPQMVQSFIDNGMRSGIPQKDWATVVPIFGDASKIIESIGNERPQSAHVVLLNGNGHIAWSSNLGYSAQQVLDLKQFVAGMPR